MRNEHGKPEVLIGNLRYLILPAMARELDTHPKQACKEQIDYAGFLLLLINLELQMRKGYRRNRGLNEAPLLKPLEAFKLEAAAGLEGRLIIKLAWSDYIRDHK